MNLNLIILHKSTILKFSLNKFINKRSVSQYLFLMYDIRMVTTTTTDNKESKVKFNFKEDKELKKEIEEILTADVNVQDAIDKLIIKHKEALTGFKYVDDIERLKRKSTRNKLFIRYVGVNGKFGWGGFFLRNDDNQIYLVNKYKAVWYIYEKQNFIFYKKVLLENERMRNDFDIFLSTVQDTIK